MPAFLILAAHATALLVEHARRVRGGAGAAAAASALGIAAIGGEAEASISHAPHERLYISPIGGGDARVTWYFPHCDYFDAGYREAIRYIAEHAEPHAEISSEIDWPSKLYAERYGRFDLHHSLLRRGYTCTLNRVCYAVVQTGRIYFLDQEAIHHLAERAPVHVVRIRGEDVVRVYRLPPGESPFPPP
jgi:hypothetical protein